MPMSPTPAPHTAQWDKLFPYFWERLFSEVLTQGVLAKKTISLRGKICPH